MGRTVWRLTQISFVALMIVSSLGIQPVLAQGGGVYVVRQGDTLIGIAARHGLTASQLAAANGLQWDSWVYVGQELKIPGQSSAPSNPAPPTTGGSYTVRPGDTLISIAARHGVTVDQLATANGLQWNAWVYIGQQLKIPGQEPSPPSTPSEPSPTPAEPTPTPSDPAPTTGGTYIVRPGDTLISIAAKHRLTVSQLAMANGLYTNSWVYVGQQLKIPGQEPSPPSTPTTPTPPAAGSTYTVRPGDTLMGIAARHGVSVSHLAAANGLNVNSWVYVGQKLQIPGQTDAPSPAPTPPSPSPTQPSPAPTQPSPAPTPPADPVSDDEKWIDVNISTQTLTAYQGQTALLTTKVSTGIWQYPTVVGTFRIYVKYTAARMRGPGYDLANVPYVMYFYRGYGLHGTYWHNNFGTPMSHGCVNLPTPDAKWVFEWAPLGTKVVTHY